MKNYNWLFEIIDDESEYCGEEFFVYETDREKAWHVARIYFPFDKMVCRGSFSDYVADMMGYDTY